MTFLEIDWTFPVAGRSQLLGVPMAWRPPRQAMAKWRWGRRKWRGPGRGRTQTWGARCGGPAPLHWPQRHLAMAWRRRQAIGTPTPSNWEGHNIKWERHNIEWKRRCGVGWGVRNNYQGAKVSSENFAKHTGAMIESTGTKQTFAESDDE